MVLSHWDADLPLADRVILNLVCKRFARDMPVSKSSLPRLTATTNTSTSNRPAARSLADQATATKRLRLNFLQRLAPWFDALTARRNPDILAIEALRATNSPNIHSFPTLLLVPNAWVFCAACVKYQLTTTLMLNLNAAQHLDPALPGVWTRCIVGPQDAHSLELQRLAVEQKKTVDLGEVERFWTVMPQKPRHVPGYFDPATRMRMMVKKVDAPERKAGRKVRVKVDAPVWVEVVNYGGGRVYRAGEREEGRMKKKAGAVLTGFEECTWLPVGLSGEREAVFQICGGHTVDPLLVVGI